MTKEIKKITSLVKLIGDKKVFMIIGHGSKNQFKSLSSLKIYVSKISKQIPKNSVIIYFGDSPNSENPDIGMAFELLVKKREDLTVYMIQIGAAKSWGFPDWVDGVYWHNDFSKNPRNPDDKWGGISKRGKLLSNTKKWVMLNKKLKSKRGYGISKIFILGGGNITLKEVEVAKKNKIPVKYYAVERKYKGDKETVVTKRDSKADKIGVTYVLRN